MINSLVIVEFLSELERQNDGLKWFGSAFQATLRPTKNVNMTRCFASDENHIKIIIKIPHNHNLSKYCHMCYI